MRCQGRSCFRGFLGYQFRLPGLAFLPDFHLYPRGVSSILCFLSLLGNHPSSHWACFFKLTQSFSIHALLSIGLILNERQTVCPRMPKKLCVECQRYPIKTFSLPHLHFGILSQQVWLGVFGPNWLCDHGQVTCPIKVGQDHGFQCMKQKKMELH